MLEMIDELETAGLTDDAERLGKGMRSVFQAAQQAGPQELEQAIAALAGVIGRLPSGSAAGVATLAGALVENGAPGAAALAEPVCGQYAVVLTHFVAFAQAWHQATEEPIPPVNPQTFEHATEVLKGSPGEDEFDKLMFGWAFLNEWNRPVLSLLGKPEFRAAVPDRGELLAAIDQVEQDSVALQRIGELLRRVGDEPAAAQ
jgi:hypothetical protein